MSKTKEMKALAEQLQQGIQRLGRHRKVALSPHQQWELTDDLEEKALKLINSLGSMEGSHASHK